MIIFDKINSHFEKKLPFVVYRKPHEKILKSYFQKNDNLDFINDFYESGFVFCSFAGTQNIIFNDYNSDIFAESFENDNAESSVPSIKNNNDVLKKMHLDLVQKGIDAIKNKEFLKVVLSRREDVPVENFNKTKAFEKLLNANKSSFCYIWSHPKIGLWMGAFSEQLVKISNVNLKTMSLAGTKQNFGTSNFFWQQKEIDEQQIVTDFIVSALQNETTAIDIEKPITVQSRNLLHLKSDITATLKPDYCLKTLLKKLHPTPAVCGFPQIESKNFIVNNENYDREFYAGFLGEINITDNSGNRNSDLFVNLRCFKIEKKQACLYIGGGITKDSNPLQEWEETVNKSLAAKNILN